MPLRSNASQKIIESGILATRTGATSLLEIEVDGHRQKTAGGFQAAPTSALSTVI
jgi:hypothetical protein